MFVLKKLYWLFFGKKGEKSLRIDLSKYFLSWSLTLLLAGLILYFIIHFVIFRYTLEVTLNEILYIFVIFFFVIIFSNYILLNFINKYIIKRFKDIEADLIEVKEENYSKRIIAQGDDELSILVNFINTLLQKVERSIQSEKKYSLIDPLTSIYNRRALIVNFESIKSNALRQGFDFSLALIDIDDFKKISDIYGHEKGDNVLKSFVKLIKKEIRQEDFFCRFGGDEFLIIFINININKTNVLLQRIRKSIKSNLKNSFKELNFDVTISAGFVHSQSYDLYESAVLNTMIVSADKNLNNAKSRGKDRIVY